MILLLKDLGRRLAAKGSECSGGEGWGASTERAPESRREGQQGKRRCITDLDSLKRLEVGRFEPYRAVARDLARRAEGASLTRRDLDLGATMGGRREGLPGIGMGRRTLRAVPMQVLHQEQMKLDDYRRPDHQAAV